MSRLKINIVFTCLMIVAGLLSLSIASAITITTFNNSLGEENLSLDGTNNITRYLDIDTTIFGYFIKGSLNITSLFNSQTLVNQSHWSSGGVSSNKESNTSGVLYTVNQDNFYVQSFRIELDGLTSCPSSTQMCGVWTEINTGQSGRIATGTYDTNPSIDGSSKYWNCNLTTPLELNNTEDYFLAFNTTYAVDNCGVLIYEDNNDLAGYETYYCDGQDNSGCGAPFGGADMGLRIYQADYTKNFSLEVGEIDGEPEYNVTGFFNGTNVFVNVLTTINNYLNGCTLDNGVCHVPFTFYSATAGIIEYFNLLFSNEGIIINSETFTTPVLAGTNQDIAINVSFDDTTYTSPSATLFYNNTQYVGTASGNGNNRVFSAGIVAPEVTALTNISFYWSIALNASDIFNSSQQNQTITQIGIDDCSVNTILLINYTVRDEEEQNILDGTNENVTTEIDLSLSTLGTENDFLHFNKTYDQTNPATVCISEGLISNASYRLDIQTRYTSLDRVLEYHNIQNFTLSNATIPQNIQLYDLATVDAQEFKIVFKDENFLPVDDALIDITRKYVGEGTFKSVEVPKTDADGQTIGHLVLSDVIYTFIVKKNGVVLATFEEVVAICQDLSTGECTINLLSTSDSGDLPDWETRNGLTFTFNYTESTRTFASVFTTVGGESSTVTLNVSTFNNDTFVCSDLTTSSSGTVTCVVPTSLANQTIVGTLYKDGVFVAQRFVTLRDTSPLDNFGLTGVVLLLLLYITMPLMFVTDRVGVVIAAILGMIFAGILGIYSSGNLFGLGSIMLWFIIAGAIIIWKITGVRKGGV